MKKKGLLLIVALFLMVVASGCSSFQNSVGKMGKGLSSSNYVVVKQSGGKVVEAYAVYNKIVNAEENSDGYMWIQDNRLFRVSGDVSVIEFKTTKEFNELLSHFHVKKEDVYGAK